MNLRKINPALWTSIIVTIIFGISLCFRIVLPYDKIFTGEAIKFASTDAYFYMRLVDNLAYNFPNLTHFDPYLIYPGGGAVGFIPFFHWMIAAIAWVIGLGSPSQHLIDVVGVYFPAICGALAVVPSYFLGKAIFGRGAGFIAAALVAIMPGEFITRTSLAATDTPAAETLFTTAAMLFLVLAIKSSAERGLTFGCFTRGEWATCRLALLYSILAGVFLGIYLATWLGAMIFVFLITCFYILQFINNHLRNRPSDHLAIVGMLSFLVAFFIFLPVSSSIDLTFASVVAIIIPPVLWVLSRLIAGWKLWPFLYPLCLAGGGAAIVIILYFAAPGVFESLLAKFRFVFLPSGSTATTTQEMQPFLAPEGSFATWNAWGNFTTSFFLFKDWPVPGLAFISLSILLYLFIRKQGGKVAWYIPLIWIVVILATLMMLAVLNTFREYRYYAVIPLAVIIYLFFKQTEDDGTRLLFFIWTLVILFATLVQRRFAYYLVINVSLLTGYLAWQVIWLAGARRLVPSPATGERPPSLAATPKDLYEILGVSRNATYREIKTAYRKLVARYQTEKDRPEIALKLKEINRAYDTLTSPERRRAYDSSRPEVPAKKKKGSIPRKRGYAYFYTGTAIVVIFFVVFFFNIRQAWSAASRPPFIPTDSWQAALTWMQDNTPEPLGDPGAYYQLHDTPPPGGSFPYPPEAYGVTAWWDYGYWITRTAHRIPSANPSQEPAPIKKVAALFLSPDEASARSLLAELDTSYLVFDYYTTTTKFWAMVDWAGQPLDDFFDTYYARVQGKIIGLQFFYPRYYQSLAVRLYNFDGAPVDKVSPIVITFDEVTDETGQRYKILKDYKGFSSYQEAYDYVQSEGPATHRIVGDNPFISPIPLEAFTGLERVYGDTTAPKPFVHRDIDLLPEPHLSEIQIPEVKIFRYTPGK